MKRWRKALLAVSGTIITVMGTALLLTWLFEEKVKSGIVAEINAQVLVPVKVDGDISLSVFRHFPYVSLSFRKVSITDKLRKGEKKLLNVEEVSFLCNIFSLFGNKIEFSKILVRGGDLSMFIDDSGKSNFEILKPRDESAKQNFSVQLKKAEIRDVNFQYTDVPGAVIVEMKIRDALLGGNFSDNNFNLEAGAKIQIRTVMAGGEKFLAGRNINVSMNLDIDKLKRRYTLSEGVVRLDDSELFVSGFAAALKKGTQLDFKFRNEGRDIQKLLALLPEKYKTGFAGASGSGEYKLGADVKGLLGQGTLPSVNMQMDLSNSEITLGRYGKLLRQVNAIAKYSMDENGNDRLVISNFSCTLNDRPFKFSLSLIKLADPDFDFYANGILQLSELTAFIPDSVMQDLDGSVTFSGFHLKGRKKDFSDVDHSTMEGTGEFKLQEVEFRQNGITYGNINGTLKYENSLIEARDFTINFLGTDFHFSGSVANLFPFVYNLSAKRSANQVVLGVNGSIVTRTFDLTGILAAYDRKNRPAEQRREKINVGEIFSMKGNLDVDIGRFIFRKMAFDELKTNLQIVPGIIRINKLSTGMMHGQLRSTGLISFTPQNSLNLNLDLTAIDLDVPEIFNACENFGQSTLTGKNLKGTLSAAVSLNATWTNYKEFDPRSLSAVIDYKITNGELIRFEPLRAASKFIRMEELEDIRFADLENTIKIADSRIDIPEFEIKTSALNLMFFGYHYFDNRVDYHFKINLHKLLAQKYKRINRDEEFVESDPYEGVNVYLSMTGELSNPKIKLDKSATRHKIQAEFKNEKTVLKDLLKNTSKNSETNRDKQEEKYFNMKEEPRFMEFDTADQ